MILVVEDEETLRTAVSQVLRKTGWSVVEAVDEPTAQHLFAAIAELDRHEAEQRQYVAEVRHEITRVVRSAQRPLQQANKK